MSRKLENAKRLYLEGIRDGNYREAISTYTGDRYTQHSTGIRDGAEGFIEFFEGFIERNPVRDIQIIRAFEDGQYVFVHVFQSLNNGQAQWITTDFFDTDENDKIVEHWDVITPYSDLTSIDGPKEITDLDQTEDNKSLVRSMIQNVLMPGVKPENIEHYISSEQFIQHNKAIPDGLEAFKTLVAKNELPVYHEIVLLVGSGNFVATLCKVTRAGTLYAQVDIFRVENGKIVERWENTEPVPPKEEWVNSGKF